MNTSQQVFLPNKKKLFVFLKSLSKYNWPSMIFIGGTHLIAILAPFWIEITQEGIFILFVLYLINTFGITVGYHRYFSHKSFTTSRLFQFILALLAQSATQNGVLWWAEKHRLHHRYSDTKDDVHSPVTQGFFYGHCGWLFILANAEKKYTLVKDLERFPELRWLDKYDQLPTIILGIIILMTSGWSGFVIGFCLSRVICWHGAFTVNSIAHLYGSQRYMTGDNSRNCFWLSLFTYGDSWHNNHHHYASSANHGFFWWEIDIGYYLLVILSWLGIVWDLKKPPPHLLTQPKYRLAKRKTSGK